MLLERLYTAVDQGKILSGLHHNKLSMPQYRDDLKRIEEAAPGAVPVVWGGDLAWNADKVVELAKQHYAEGYVIALTWHCARPYDMGTVDFKVQTQGKMTDRQWCEMLDEGTSMRRMWERQVDEMAQYLKQLQDARVPVLWRPYHEMNGDWFWWGNHRGDAYGFNKLWTILYDRLTNYHHLNNLIWVWNPNNPRKHPHDPLMAYENFYPGSEYVDVLAADVYHNEWFDDTHNQLLTLGNEKLIALGEVGSLPSVQQLSAYRRYAWFMLWTDFTEKKYNTAERLNEIFAADYVQNMPFVTNWPAGTTIAPIGHQISPADQRIQYIGRVSLSNPTAPLFTFPGVQIRARFGGTSLKMMAKPMSGYFMASIDGCKAFKVGFNSPNDSIVSLAAGLTNGQHEVQIMYVTEGYDRRAEFWGFILDDKADLLQPAPLPSRKIEFIGNSITCGYGVESMVCSDPFSDETCNHYLTYAAETARRLDALHVVVARSGIGVYRNYDGPHEGDRINMNTEYLHTLLYDSTQVWDFNRFTPDVVCINLGTNDTSTSGAEPYLLKKGYKDLLAKVRNAYPNAKIVFLCGCMMHGDALQLATNTMNQVVAEANQAGDKQVYRFDFTPQNGSLGYGASWHPSMWQQQKMADELTPFLQQLMSW